MSIRQSFPLKIRSREQERFSLVAIACCLIVCAGMKLFFQPYLDEQPGTVNIVFAQSVAGVSAQLFGMLAVVASLLLLKWWAAFIFFIYTLVIISGRVLWDIFSMKF